MPSFHGMMYWTIEFSLVETPGTAALFHGREGRIDTKEQDMGKVEEPESKKSSFWNVSPISPPFTIVVVVVLIVLLTVVLKNSLST